MLIEDLAVVMRVQLTDQSVLHHSPLKFHIAALIEHVFQNFLECPIGVLKLLFIKAVISSSDDTFEET